MKQNEEKEGRKRGLAWLFIVLGLVLIGWAVYFFKFSGNGGSSAPGSSVASPVTNAAIQVCVEAKMMNAKQCCDPDQPQISIFESSNIFFVTAQLPDLKTPNPTVTAAVHWPTGEKFPTQPIVLTKNAANSAGCFAGKVQPIHGTAWSLGKYILKLEVDGQPAGEREFEIVR